MTRPVVSDAARSLLLTLHAAGGSLPWAELPARLWPAARVATRRGLVALYTRPGPGAVSGGPALTDAGRQLAGELARDVSGRHALPSTAAR